MTFRDNILTRVNNIGTELRDVQNTDRHIQYKQGLYEELLAIQQLWLSGFLNLDAMDANKPFEVETRGIT